MIAYSFKVVNDGVQEGLTASPPTSDAATPFAVNGKGRVSTAVYAKNLEMKLEDMERVKKALELELRAMKQEAQKGHGRNQDEHQRLQVCLSGSCLYKSLTDHLKCVLRSGVVDQ